VFVAWELENLASWDLGISVPHSYPFNPFPFPPASLDTYVALAEDRIANISGAGVTSICVELSCLFAGASTSPDPKSESLGGARWNLLIMAGLGLAVLHGIPDSLTQGSRHRDKVVPQ